MVRSLFFVLVILLALLPVAVSADSVFLPALAAGVRDWFTVSDVVQWSAAQGNVMPIWCVEARPGIFTTCTVQQAQPLTLVWSNELGKVVAK